MSKITIPTEVWVELYAELAGWHVEDYFSGIYEGRAKPFYLRKEDEHGNESYTEEAQEKFNDAVDDVEKIMSNFFIKEGEE